MLLVEKCLSFLLITPAMIPYENFLYNLAAFVKATGVGKTTSGTFL